MISDGRFLYLSLTIVPTSSKISLVAGEATENACVAQLDRASGYGPEGREFESCRTQKKALRRFLLSAFLLSFFFHLIRCPVVPARRDEGEKHLIPAMSGAAQNAQYLPTKRQARGNPGLPFLHHSGAVFGCFQSLLTMQAQPMPPPTQRVARPFFASLFIIS